MQKITKKLIAPCGMDCGLCLHYLREENKCPGCFSGRKVNGRPIKCGIRLCEQRQDEFCFECTQFPCDRLKRLDKRYREKYIISEIDNLKFIRDNGIEKFIEKECEKWQSEKGTFCIHDKKYY